MKLKPSGRIFNLAYVFSVASLLLALDIITKAVIYENLSIGQSIKIIPGIFHITLVLNKGAAFGLLKDQRLFFISLSILAVSFIIAYMLKAKRIDNFLLLASGLLLGGAIGNLADRIRFGYVIDFFDFRVWPVFNVADSAITVGAIILALNIILRSP